MIILGVICLAAAPLSVVWAWTKRETRRLNPPVTDWTLTDGYIVSSDQASGLRYRYRYEIGGGTMLTSNRYSLGGTPVQPEVAYQPGQRVEVRFNPHSPASAVLSWDDPGARWRATLFWAGQALAHALCLALMLLGVGLLFSSAKR